MVQIEAPWLWLSLLEQDLPAGKSFVGDVGLILGFSQGFVTSGSFNLRPKPRDAAYSMRAL